MICAACEAETPASPCASCGQEPRLDGRYALLRPLGRGAHGTTFFATGPDGDCAIKELHLGRVSSGKASELFEREANVMAQLSHPAIPAHHEHFVRGRGASRTLYLIQDFAPGETLEQRLEHHRYSEAEVQDVVQQVAGILTYLHGLSPPVIHRDIKPANLLRDADGRVRLVDFGAVRDVIRDSVGGGSTVAGTFGYMAPEQLVGDATAKSDLYALGATAVHLLTRKRPVELADRQGVVRWRQGTQVSDGFAATLDALLQRDPDHRPASAQAVVDGVVAAPAYQPGPAVTLVPVPAVASPSGPKNILSTVAAWVFGRWWVRRVWTLPHAVTSHEASQIAHAAADGGLVDRSFSGGLAQAHEPVAGHWLWQNGLLRTTRLAVQRDGPRTVVTLEQALWARALGLSVATTILSHALASLLLGDWFYVGWSGLMPVLVALLAVRAAIAIAESRREHRIGAFARRLQSAWWTPEGLDLDGYAETIGGSRILGLILGRARTTLFQRTDREHSADALAARPEAQFAERVGLLTESDGNTVDVVVNHRDVRVVLYGVAALISGGWTYTTLNAAAVAHSSSFSDIGLPTVAVVFLAVSTVTFGLARLAAYGTSLASIVRARRLTDLARDKASVVVPHDERLPHEARTTAAPRSAASQAEPDRQG